MRLKDETTALCWFVMCACALSTFYAYDIWTNKKRELSFDEIVPERADIPVGISQWKPQSISLSTISAVRAQGIADDGTVLLCDIPNEKVFQTWKDGVLKRVQGKYLTITPKGELRETSRYSLMGYTEQVFRSDKFLYQTRVRDTSIYARGKNDSEWQRIAAVDRRFLMNPYSYGFRLNTRDELVYPRFTDSGFEVIRKAGFEQDQVIVRGKCDDEVLISNYLPKELKDGHHVILSVDGNASVFSDGKKWKLDAPSGFVAVPMVFATPDIVAGRLMKNGDDEASLYGGTIAFWNREGKVCLIDDVLSERRKEFKTLLSPRNGFTRNCYAISNFAGTVTFTTDSRSLGFPSQPSHVRSSLILRITP